LLTWPNLKFHHFSTLEVFRSLGTKKSGSGAALVDFGAPGPTSGLITPYHDFFFQVIGKTEIFGFEFTYQIVGALVRFGFDSNPEPESIESRCTTS